MRTHFVIASLAFTAGQCNQDSVYPAYELSDLVSEPRLAGTWINDDDDLFVIRAAGPTRFALCMMEGDDTTRFELHLARAEGLLFVDMVPAVSADQTLPLHEHAIVGELDSLLVYRSFSDDWLRAYLQDNPAALSHLEVDGHMLLTATPRALQRFVAQHQHDPGAMRSDTLHRAASEAMRSGC